MKLKIRPIRAEEIYRDFIRIPEQYRMDRTGKLVPEGTICRIFSGNRSCYGIVRGLVDEEKLVARLDERLRDELGLKDHETSEIELKAVGPWGQFCWALKASDPAYRIAAQLSALSVILGAIGFILGVFSLLRCS